MRNILRDEAAVEAKFGVKPSSIPDYLAVVGDTADGYPGVDGWGAKSAALTFSRYPHLEDIPRNWQEWDPSIRSARRLSESLFIAWSDALLFRTLATLRLDAPVSCPVDALRWTGPQVSFEKLCQRMNAPELFSRAVSAAEGRSLRAQAVTV
jgi:5'-3' exonuclease